MIISGGVRTGWLDAERLADQFERERELVKEVEKRHLVLRETRTRLSWG